MEREKMEKYLDDFEVKNLSTREDLANVLEFTAKDEWTQPYVLECAAVGIAKAPLFFAQFKGKIKVERKPGVEIEALGVTCDDDDLETVAAGDGLLLVCPKDNKYQTFPLRYTAFPSVCGRAGISGPTISNTTDKPSVSALPVEEKANWISRGFSLHSAVCKILLRDGKVSAMLSNDYQVLPDDKLVDALESQLKIDFPDYEFISGMFSHEYLTVDYLLHDGPMETNFAQMLINFGMRNDIEVKAGVRFSTSDIGASKVKATPFFDICGTTLIMGKPCEISHLAQKTVDDFANAVMSLNAAFKENEDQIERLGNTDIKYPTDCLQNIIKKHPLFVSCSEDAIDTLKVLPKGTATAIDVYLAFNQIILTKNQKKALSPTQLVNLSEEAAKLMFIDYGVYDHFYVENED